MRDGFIISGSFKIQDSFKGVRRGCTLAFVAKNMIIAPGEGPAALAIAQAARNAGWRVISARKQGASGSPRAGASASTSPGDLEGGELILGWNPASYISAGALAINAVSAGPIDALVIVSEPEGEGPSLFDGAPGSLAAGLEEASLGPVWIAREMIRRFESVKAGQLLAVSIEGFDETPRAPGEAAWPAFVRSAFRGFGEGLFDRARGAAWKAWGIADRGGKPEALAAFAIALLDEGKGAKSGRWLPFNGKSGLFGIF